MLLSVFFYGRWLNQYNKIMVWNSYFRHVHPVFRQVGIRSIYCIIQKSRMNKWKVYKVALAKSFPSVRWWERDQLRFSHFPRFPNFKITRQFSFVFRNIAAVFPLIFYFRLKHKVLQNGLNMLRYVHQTTKRGKNWEFTYLSSKHRVIEDCFNVLE